jgi:hypothetical protein
MQPMKIPGKAKAVRNFFSFGQGRRVPSEHNKREFHFTGASPVMIAVTMVLVRNKNDSRL